MGKNQDRPKLTVDKKPRSALSPEEAEKFKGFLTSVAEQLTNGDIRQSADSLARKKRRKR